MIKPLPAAALIMGYGGLIPFVALSIIVTAGIELPNFSTERFAQLLLGYAAIILSFVGAVHWGFALAKDGNFPPESANRFYTYSVIPAVLAWDILFLPQCQ